MPKAKVAEPKTETKAAPLEKTAIIAKVAFESNVCGFKMLDELKLRARTLKEAKEIFMAWVAKNSGIKGDSGIFHPLSGYGDIRIKSVVEQPHINKILTSWEEPSAKDSGKDGSEESRGEVPADSHD